MHRSTFSTINRDARRPSSHHGLPHPRDGQRLRPIQRNQLRRGNLSFTSINLPRIAIEADHDEKRFYEKLDEMLDLVANQLLDRFEIQASKRVYNYPFLMGQGVWLDSDKLNQTMRCVRCSSTEPFRLASSVWQKP